MSHSETRHPGIFVAGDVVDTYAEQVLICIGKGAQAALSAYEYILVSWQVLVQRTDRKSTCSSFAACSFNFVHI